MEKQAAMHILTSLAQGVDPHSGEVFPAGSPYQHPDTVRALFQAVEAMQASTAGSPPARSRLAGQGLPENAGKPWSDEEDSTLAAAFDAGKPIPELAQLHRRTRAAIQARLIKLGRIEPTAGTPRFRIEMPAAQTA